MTTTVSVENLGKRYVIGRRRREDLPTFRETLSGWARGLGRRLRHPLSTVGAGTESRTFWALRDLTLDVERGDRIGIIGRNGAGKTTLLKIVSRITAPTTGRVKVRGRVASLLEVGTGFHPELTGRENIFLNGAILGMRGAEIRERFDAIVEFAEVDEFLETPVKRYSSGMYVRLAFAVAAHLEPDILLMDEVLAVGDVAFQRKCLGKMRDVGLGGRTVLFVSHDMNAVEALCNRAVLIESGRLVAHDENVRAVIQHYLRDGEQGDRETHWTDEAGTQGNEWFRPTRFSLVDAEGAPLTLPVRNDTEMWVRLEGEIEREDSGLNLGFAVYDDRLRCVFWSCYTDTPEGASARLERGRVALACRIPSRLLNEGVYRIVLMASLHYREWILTPVSSDVFVKLAIQGGLSDSPFWIVRRPGVIAPELQWVLL